MGMALEKTKKKNNNNNKIKSKLDDGAPFIKTMKLLGSQVAIHESLKALF